MTRIGEPEVLEPTSPTGAGRYGESLSLAGDVNGDGLVDLVVGAPGESGGSGTVYLYAGTSDAVLPPAATLVSSTPTSAGAFGTAIATAGDLDGDGLAELVIGASGEGDGGAVHVFRGTDGGPAFASSVAPTVTVVGAAFGSRVSTSGDLDGDGLHDIAIGSFRDGSSLAESGAAYVLLGSTGLSNTPTLIESPTPEASGSFGYSVSLCTRVADGGRAVLQLGALESVGAEAMAGRVYVQTSGSSPTIAFEAPTPEAGSSFGASVVDVAVSGVGFDPI